MPGKNPSFNQTDAGNAELFACLYATVLRFDHRRQRWLQWQEHHWREDRTQAVYQLAKEAARSRYTEVSNIDGPDERQAAAKWAMRSESRSSIEATLALAKSSRPLSDEGDGWDDNPWLLGVQNGVIDLREGRMRAGQPSDKITKCSPVIYDPDATCPTFMRFLERVVPDQAMREYLQKQAGYCLTGDTSEQDLAILCGPGGNGKTTFVDVLMFVLGDDYAKQAAPGLLLRRYHDPHPTELSDLEGARLVVSSEIDDGQALAEGLIKQLTGNDRIRARRMRQDFYEFRPSHKIILTVNHKPRIVGTDLGIWRRLKVVPFDVTIPGEEREKHLAEQLHAEAPGILNWMIVGCLAWQRDGLLEPSSMIAAIDEYRTGSDPLGAFLKNCLIGDEHSVRGKDLYSFYRSWALDEGHLERDIMSQTAFGRLISKQFEKRTDRMGVQYLGIAPCRDPLAALLSGLVVDSVKSEECIPISS